MATLKDLRGYPITLTFLVAYLFYNDGIQTVIYAASVYGEKELGFEKSTVLIATFLIVQFVAHRRRAAASAGSRPAARRQRHDPGRAGDLDGRRDRRLLPPGGELRRSSSLLAAAIGLVLGGTQALSRSYFSQLIPRGREAEYFSLYQAMRARHELGRHPDLRPGAPVDRLLPARRCFALIVFFVLGGVLLSRVDTERGIREAGQRGPGRDLSISCRVLVLDERFPESCTAHYR